MLIPASQEELQREMVDNAMRTWRKKLNAADAFDAALEAHVSRGEGDEFAATVPQLRALLLRRTRSKMATSGFDSLDSDAKESMAGFHLSHETRSKMATSGFDSLDSDEKERMANIIAGNDLKVGKLQRGATVDDKVAALAACCAEANSGDGPRRAPLNRVMKDRGVLHFYTQHISGISSNFGRWRAISKDVKLAMEALGPPAFGTRFADVPPSELATELKRCADKPAVRFSNLALAFKTNGGDPPTSRSEMYQFWRHLRTGGGLSTAGRQEELTRANLTPHDFGFECEGDTEGQVLRLLQAQVQAANSKAVVCKTRKRKADSSIADGTPSGSSAVGEGAIKPKKKRRTKESPAVDVAQLHQEGKFETITADQIRRWLQKVKGVKAFTLTADTEVTARAGGVKTVTVHASAEPYKIDGWTRSHVLKAVALTIILK